MKKEYAYTKSVFAKPELKNELWQEYLSEENLYYTIAKKENNAFIGYCGVKNLSRVIWEIAIEIKSDCCYKGYGYRALKMYLAAEEEYKDRLDDRYMELAKKFNVEPRKLLSHVLEYRIVV